MLICEPLEHCACCDAPADVLDDCGVPYCATCWLAIEAHEMAADEREAGYRTDRDAASDMEVRRGV